MDKTLRDLQKCINEMVEEHPEWMDFPLIYSSDDEGNEYNKVNQLPCGAKVSNINENRFLDLEHFEEDNKTDINCIIIN